jgi:hypothetical protein
MYRKLLAAFMAAFALAAVVPAMASAAPEVTFPTGTTLAAGSAITAKNVGETVMTGAFNVRCTTAHMKGTLTENSGTSIKGDITTATFSGTGTGGDCTSALGSTRVEVNSLPWCLSANNKMAADEFQVRGGACTAAAAGIKFILEVTGTGPCEYERSTTTGPIKGTFTTHSTGDALLTISEQEAVKIAGGFFCPSSGKLDMTFTLEKEGAGPVYIS